MSFQIDYSDRPFDVVLLDSGFDPVSLAREHGLKAATCAPDMLCLGTSVDEHEAHRLLAIARQKGLRPIALSSRYREQPHLTVERAADLARQAVASNRGIVSAELLRQKHGPMWFGFAAPLLGDEDDVTRVLVDKVTGELVSSEQCERAILRWEPTPELSTAIADILGSDRSRAAHAATWLLQQTTPEARKHASKLEAIYSRKSRQWPPLPDE